MLIFEFDLFGDVSSEFKEFPQLQLCKEGRHLLVLAVVEINHNLHGFFPHPLEDEGVDENYLLSWMLQNRRFFYLVAQLYFQRHVFLLYDGIVEELQLAQDGIYGDDSVGLLDLLFLSLLGFRVLLGVEPLLLFLYLLQLFLGPEERLSLELYIADLSLLEFNHGGEREFSIHLHISLESEVKYSGYFLFAELEEEPVLFADTGFEGLFIRRKHRFREGGLGLIVQPVGGVLGRGRLLLDVELYLRLYLLFEVEFDWVVVDVDSVLLQLKGKIFLLLPPIDQEVQVKFGIVFESAHETDSEVGEFEQVQIIHLLLDCVGDFGLHHFILDEYLADGLLLVVDDVDLAGQTALVLVVQGDVYDRFGQTQGLCYLILGEVDGLTFLQAYKLEFQRTVLFAQRKDEGFLPDQILLLRGWLTVAFSAVIGEPAVDGLVFVYLLQLGLPQSDDQLFLHNKYIDRPLLVFDITLVNCPMNPVYEVEAILDEAIIDNQPHYLIKWKNHSHQHDTWEPISNLQNIAEFLQQWLRKRRERASSNRKEQSKAEFKSIKPYIYREHLKPSRKTTRQKYAQEILNKKKMWQKYIQRQEKCIQVDSSETKPPRALKQPPMVNQENHGISAQIENPCNQMKGKQNFKVVGSIDTSQISKIVRLFVWRETKCAEVELSDGRRFNMKEEELKQYQPLMVVEYYENEGVVF